MEGESGMMWKRMTSNQAEARLKICRQREPTTPRACLVFLFFYSKPTSTIHHNTIKNVSKIRK